MTNALDHPTNLREHLRVLRARKFEILLIVVLVVGTTAFFTWRQRPIYEGQAEILVRAVQSPSATVSVQQAPNLETEREVVQSVAVAQTVQKRLHLRVSPEALLQNLTVDVVAETEVLVVKYEDRSPATAARLTNAFADAYVDFRTHESLQQFEVATGAVQKQVRDLQSRIATLNAQIDAAHTRREVDSLQSQRDTFVAQLGVLQQRLLDLQSSASINQTSAADVIQPADVPRSPAIPKKRRNLALAGIAGILLGIGVAFLRERLDDRVKSRSELEEALGVPVLAAIQRVDGWRRKHEAHLAFREDPKGIVAEAYRTLATNVQYLAASDPVRVLLVTSATGGDGKTTTSCNLAMALAATGKRVILLSADLRRPRLHMFFGLANDKGVSSVLALGYPLSRVARDPGMPNLRVVPSGPVPQDPAGLLVHDRARLFIEAAQSVADYVVMDSPPVLAVADASILVPLVDAVLFVVDARRSGTSAIIQARDQLRQAGANLVGSVYNNFDPAHSAVYRYDYRYDSDPRTPLLRERLRPRTGSSIEEEDEGLSDLFSNAKRR